MKRMNLTFDVSLAKNYKSKSQITRRLSESWTEKNMFCPYCGGNFSHTKNNTPVKDFFCCNCNKFFELKSVGHKIGGKIVCGAYNKMYEMIKNDTNPDFLLLHYDKNSNIVKDLVIIPSYFITYKVIQKRKPLSRKARRAGWVGCNLLLNDIQKQGWIFVVRDGKILNKYDIICAMKKVYASLHEAKTRSWTLDVLKCVNKIYESEFALAQLYEFEGELQAEHKNNHNVRAKIRQQLQIIRDMGVIEFLKNGHYRKCPVQ